MESVTRHVYQLIFVICLLWCGYGQQEETESSGDGEVTPRNDGRNPISTGPHVDMSTAVPETPSV